MTIKEIPSGERFALAAAWLFCKWGGASSNLCSSLALSAHYRCFLLVAFSPIPSGGSTSHRLLLISTRPQLVLSPLIPLSAANRRCSKSCSEPRSGGERLKYSEGGAHCYLVLRLILRPQGSGVCWTTILAESLPHHVFPQGTPCGSPSKSWTSARLLLCLCVGLAIFCFLSTLETKPITDWIHPADHQFRTPNWLAWTRNAWPCWNNFDLLLQCWFIYNAFEKAWTLKPRNPSTQPPG